MKMSEFLALSDDKKEIVMGKMEEAMEVGCEPNYSVVTEDLGTCSQCGKPADAGDFCFGCHKLVCPGCIEIEPHLSHCLAK